MLKEVANQNLPDGLCERTNISLTDSSSSPVKNLANRAIVELFKSLLESNQLSLYAVDSGLADRWTNNVVIYMPILHLNPFFPIPQNQVVAYFDLGSMSCQSF